MSKKNLLNESQVRKFMKLANLEPLSPGFVNGMTSLTEEEGSKWKDGEHEYKRRGKSKKHPVGHRAGEVKGPDGKMHYKTGETDDLKEEEGSKKGEYKRRGKSQKHPVGHRAGDVDGHYKAFETNESHGRGRGEGAAGYGHHDANTRLEEEEDPAELEGDIEHDLGDDSLEGDEEALGDEAEIDDELDDDADMDAELDAADGGRMVSVDDFLSALENALETAMGDEVEVDASEMSDEVEDEDEFAPEGDEVVADMEVEDEVELAEAFTGPSVNDPERVAWEKSKKPSKDDDRPKGSAAGDRMRSRRGRASGAGGMKIGGITAEGEEGSKWKDGEHEYKRRGKSKKHPVGHRAGEVKGPDGKMHYKTGETNESLSATDELVEQITKRVAARILKSALAKK